MSTFSADLVRPLRLAENHFLEVLLSDFKLTRRGGGTHLEISFDADSPATWNRSGRAEVHRKILDFERKAEAYQKQLERFIFGKHTAELTFKDPEFFFRWASAGALPVVRIKDEDYYCLFYREIFPIGWNIANGACDNVSELLDPLSTLERELREELIVLDLVNRYWYVLEQAANLGTRPDIVAVKSILSERAKSARRRGSAKKQIALGDLRQLETPLKWLQGPDSVTIKMGKSVSEVEGCFLNINALDFGIEVDRVAKINLGEDVVLCDGEVAQGQLLNRLVGLFKVSELDPNSPAKKFIPDRFFYNGICYTKREFSRIMGPRFLRDIGRKRPKHELDAYRSCPHPYDLCPVTRNIIRRYVKSSRQQRRLSKSVDVFVSFGRGDEGPAREIAEFVAQVCKKKVFFYPESRYDQLWDRAIDEALESATCLIAVGSKLSRLKRRWPEYEYRTFHKDILNGKKRGNLISIVAGIAPADLPLPLRYYAIESCRDVEDILPLMQQIKAKLCSGLGRG